MAKADKPSASLDAIRKEIEQYRKEQDMAPAGERDRILVKIKVLRSCERLLVDFYGDDPRKHYEPDDK